jgi:hypothetical protein
VDGDGGGCGLAAGQGGNELGFRGCGCLYTLPMRSQSSNQRWTTRNSRAIWADTGFVSFLLYLAFFFFFFRFMHHCEVSHINNNLICIIIFFKYNILHISYYYEVPVIYSLIYHFLQFK